MLNNLITEEEATRDALELTHQALMANNGGGSAPNQYQAAPSVDLFGELPAPTTTATNAVYGSSEDYQPTTTSSVGAPGGGTTMNSSMSGPPMSNGPLSAQLPQSSYEYSQAPPPSYMNPPAPPSTDHMNIMGSQPSAMDHLTTGGNHNQGVPASSSFDFHDGAYMGGGGPLSSVDTTTATRPVMNYSSTSAATAAPPSSSSKQPMPAVDFEEMRKKAKEADDIARQAEERSIAVLGEIAVLRKAAEEAEIALAEHKQASESGAGGKEGKKKGGLFGGGASKQQKKDAKVEQQLTLDAKAKKNDLLQAQGRANDAQALAIETRREADRLQRAVEETEMAQASANSLSQTTTSTLTLPTSNTTNASSSSYDHYSNTTTTGYNHDHNDGYSNNNNHLGGGGYGPPPTGPSSYSNSSSAGSVDPSQPYDNPFRV